MDDNLYLANFIVSFGSMNGYSSTVLQTKLALDFHDLSQLENQHHDGGLLKDALDGITVAQKMGFSTKSIIEINKTFVHNQNEDPNIPGHLRKASSNLDDAVIVVTDPNGTVNGAYYAPENVCPQDLDNIVNEFKSSQQSGKDAWRVFAELSKLQPFQDGNKRTALIAANAALSTWGSKDYLILPFDNIEHVAFMVNLMRFYRATTKKRENIALDRIIDTLPSPKEVQCYLSNSIEQEDEGINKLKNKRVKSFFKKNLD